LLAPAILHLRSKRFKFIPFAPQSPFSLHGVGWHGMPQGVLCLACPNLKRKPITAHEKSLVSRLFSLLVIIHQ
jgi:hypothetical protein